MWSRLSGALDVGVRTAIRFAETRGRPTVARRDPGGTLRWLAAIARDYPEAAEALHPQPAPFEPVAVAVPRARPLPDGGALLRLTWPSDVVPLVPGSRLRNDRFNRLAVARWRRHPGPARPAVVVVHGYGAGQWALEDRLWPVAALYARGYDVLQFQLPFHGERAHPGRRGLPGFPGSDPRRNLEGFRQTILDLRGLLGFLRARGAPAVGLWGMSLGSYTAALAARLAPVEALVLTIPLASLTDYARTHRSLAPGSVGEAQAHLLRRIYRPIDPLVGTPQVTPERVLTLVAERDGITPVAHGEWLAAHFGGALHRWPGGHLVALGRGPGWRLALDHTTAALG